MWEAGQDGKRRRQLVQATEYCYEADMEGAHTAPVWQYLGSHAVVLLQPPNAAMHPADCNGTAIAPVRA